jgi:hypothetical protein
MYEWLVDDLGIAETPIHYIEFGVYKGHTLRWWTQANRHPESTFAGFDTFEGLPEDWEDVPKGAFSVGGALPAIEDPRCSLVQGMFQDTLVGWLKGRDLPHRKVVHLDADLYSSTLFALTQLLPILVRNDVLIFDEFDAYLHEFRALTDALSAYRREVAPLCHSSGWHQVAVVMK